jgi:hypothetical protein
MKNKFLILAAVLFTALLALAQNTASRGNDLPPGSPQLMQPEELAKVIQSTTGQKPVVLYVGPRTFYVQAHISGAEYIGPTSKPDGLGKLRARAKSLARDSVVVIYCGCCPWEHCPNIRPAYAELEKMGFQKLRVLYLTNSFGTNWVDKGYPVAKGE